MIAEILLKFLLLVFIFNFFELYKYLFTNDGKCQMWNADDEIID